LYGSRGLEFEPGSKWSYSNYGFILLGAVIEKVSGLSYYEYVRKHVFEPAGMHATDSLPEVDSVAKRSVGYMRKNSAWVNNADTLPWIFLETASPQPRTMPPWVMPELR
jgi:CubicO group peptidase (beta-lactamase class C family)